MQSITMQPNRQPFVIREEKLQLKYFHSDDEDDSLKPRSLSRLDLSPTKKEKADTKKRSVKKSMSFGEQKHQQRPVRRKSSRSKAKSSIKPLPEVPEELRIQKFPQRSTSSGTSSSDEFSDLQAEFRRERRSRRSPTPRASPRQTREKNPELEEEFRRERRERKSYSRRNSPKPLESSSHRPMRSSSMEVKSPVKESRNGKQPGRRSSSSSLSNDHLRPKRSRSRNYRKSPTPREWYHQLQQNDDPQRERPGSRRSLSRNSKSPKVRKSSRKSLKQESKGERKPLGRKSTSFRKKSPGRVASRESHNELEATPLEWHQQLQRREDQQEERPRSSRRRLSLTSLESLSKRNQEEDEHSQRRRRSTSRRSSKSSRSSRKSKTPDVPAEFYIVQDDTERLTRRRSLGKKTSSYRRKKSPTPPASWSSQGKEGEEESHGSQKSLGTKTPSFERRRSPTFLGSRQHQYRKQENEIADERPSSKKSLGKPLRRRSSQQKAPGAHDDPGPRRKSLLERSTSFSNKITQPRRSLTPDRLQRRISLGKKVSLRNIFGTKKDGELDWKELGFKECSYYQNNSGSNSAGSLKRRLSGPKNRLSSLTRLSTFSKNSGNNQGAEGVGLLNATWDKQDPEAEKTPGPLRSWSAFRRGSSPKRNDEGEGTDKSSSFEERPYEDRSIHSSPIRAM